MSGIEKLPPDHKRLNAAFPWPTAWPAGINEARLVLRFTSFANYLWRRICEGHTHPQESDPRVRQFEVEEPGAVELKFTR